MKKNVSSSESLCNLQNFCVSDICLPLCAQITLSSAHIEYPLL